MKPKRDRKRWLEDAPEFVMAVRDCPSAIDRFTIYLGGSLALANTPAANWREEYLAVDEGGGRGFSQFGEAPRGNRRAAGRTIRWLDLPEAVRRHVVARCTPV